MDHCDFAEIKKGGKNFHPFLCLSNLNLFSVHQQEFPEAILSR